MEFQERCSWGSMGAPRGYKDFLEIFRVSETFQGIREFSRDFRGVQGVPESVPRDLREIQKGQGFIGFEALSEEYQFCFRGLQEVSVVFYGCYRGLRWLHRRSRGFQRRPMHPTEIPSEFSWIYLKSFDAPLKHI